MQYLKKYSFTSAALLFFLFLCTAIISETTVILIIPFIILALIIATGSLKLLWFLLIFLLPLSFEYQITPALGLDIPDELLMIFLTISFLFLLSLQKISLPKLVMNHPIISVLALGLFWSLVCTMFSSNWTISIKYFIAKFWYLIPFTLLPWFTITNKKDFVYFGYLLGGSMLFTVIYTMLNHAALRFLFDNINSAVAPFFRNHVNYAAMLVCTLPVAGCFYTLSKSKKQKNIIIGIILVLLFALFFSYSRGAWLALLVGIAAVFLLQKKLLGISFLLIAAAIIITLLFLSKENRYLNYHSNYKKTIYHANFNDHMQATFMGTDMSNAERFNRWIAALRMKNEHPITGFGPNTFYDNYKPYIVSYFKTWVSENKEKSTVHNYFLLLLVEQGWVGLIIFLLLLVVTFKRIEYLFATVTDPFYKTIVLCIGVIFCMILTLNMLSDLIETDKIGSLFYLCLGFLIWIDVKNKNKVLQ